MRRACYVAGRMRGREDYHFPLFFAAEFALRGAGWEVFNPARMDIIADGWPNVDAREGTPAEHRVGLRTDVATLDESKIGPADCRKYAKRDCLFLIDYLRAERGDALVVLPGWELSIGANAEVAVARWIQLPIIELDAAVAMGGLL